MPVWRAVRSRFTEALHRCREKQECSGKGRVGLCLLRGRTVQVSHLNLAGGGGDH